MCALKNNKIRKNLLAELEEDLLKDKNRPCAAQDCQRLTSKKRVGYSSHGRSKQGLNSTLKTGNNTLIPLLKS